MPATVRVKQITLDSLIKPYDRPVSSLEKKQEPANATPGFENIALGRTPPPFPTTPTARKAFLRPKSQRKVTPFQWQLYDALLTIPSGRVATYRQLAEHLTGSANGARAIGSALRENPFAPYVPCHRVIATNLYIGGFGGEWLPTRRRRRRETSKDIVDGTRTNEKLELLKQEGVTFDSKGFLKDKTKLWTPPCRPPKAAGATSP
ncbi:putative Methylated-DNA--[protein]-cysteine S-methyltransferase [Rhodotorula taiwanensis]|uniref:Methylated-DNA--protein-cysteine methyltransferase n=1 Tax=Rhodotorula taiwanensis TaxID=741276 RepID=A0A2S5BJD4_9BASI|nr:putative Methylated-DNA--[protein]-cysteine S-methyltransferase [Rhodotorula taiwanensis]